MPVFGFTERVAVCITRPLRFDSVVEEEDPVGNKNCEIIRRDRDDDAERKPSAFSGVPACFPEEVHRLSPSSFCEGS